MISGLGKIDVDDWKRHTRLKHCTLETNIVRWFWRVVDEYDEEHRARLLQFVTGSSRVPLQGFRALQGSLMCLVLFLVLSVVFASLFSSIRFQFVYEFSVMSFAFDLVTP